MRKDLVHLCVLHQHHLHHICKERQQGPHHSRTARGASGLSGGQGFRHAQRSASGRPYGHKPLCRHLARCSEGRSLWVGGCVCFKVLRVSSWAPERLLHFSLLLHGGPRKVPRTPEWDLI